MPFPTIAEYETHLGRSITAPEERSATSAALQAVSSAVQAALLPVMLTPSALTVVVDGVPGRDLVCPYRPVRAVDAVYVSPRASGDASRFTSEHLLSPSEYALVLDEWYDGVMLSRCGIIRRVRGLWGVQYVREVGTLAPRLHPVPGGVRLDVLVGYPTVPPNVALAIFLMTTIILRRRQFGAPLSSESWNGYSYSLDTSLLKVLMEGDDVASLLRPYQSLSSGFA